MGSQDAVEAVRRWLIHRRYYAPSRVLGDVNRLILRVDYRPGFPPDGVIRQLDPMARPLLRPPVEQGLSTWIRVRAPPADRDHEPDAATEERQQHQRRRGRADRADRLTHKSPR
jgi:hypothetical protein